MVHQSNGKPPSSAFVVSKAYTDDLRSTFYYPMTGIINLFIHILRFPTLFTARSDIALLEVMAGHFAHMEFVTGSELNFPFARNVAALARQTVEKASQSESHTPIPPGLEHGSEQEMDMPSQVSKTRMLDLVAYQAERYGRVFLTTPTKTLVWMTGVSSPRRSWKMNLLIPSLALT